MDGFFRFADFHRWMLRAVVVGALALLVACGGPSQPAPPPTATAGLPRFTPTLPPATETASYAPVATATFTAEVAPSPTVTITTTPGRPPSPTARSWWQPKPRTTWQIQINGGQIDLSYQAQVYDVDLFDTPTETIAQLHRMGRKVICYFSAGTYEDWRPDADRFLGYGIVGQPLEDWPGERYLDIRRLDILGPILQDRLDLAVEKGCDAVDPDNVQNFQEPTGFALSSEDQLRFNLWLAGEAHARGLGVGLKNDRPQIPDLVAAFDFAVDEECFTYAECEPLLAFIRAGKAVFEIEYELSPAAFCPQANAWGFSALVKPWDLSPQRFDCLQDFEER
ncbi:MAG TPA: endo alpha-1,4 polygalactosaminidase [Anaerolineae bacterium]|nr:endo alpha-1,4 polygalactosaminidase [Anaerolineae bacterium]HID83749.1 endo alpha-1,4 polygalactosaminidase [Anaerolineales bacterium]HIQ08674.1 endo alpha-1,4 polygalactosaminidase [Anaerolineaceae bacterium]